VTWAAVGARTTESRKRIGKWPVGFDADRVQRNGTDGSLQIAFGCRCNRRVRHTAFSELIQEGITSIIRTTGNQAGHIVLRGGRSRPELRRRKVSAKPKRKLTQAGLPPVMMVIAATRNSAETANSRQGKKVLAAVVIEQRAAGTRSVIGCDG